MNYVLIDANIWIWWATTSTVQLLNERDFRNNETYAELASICTVWLQIIKTIYDEDEGGEYPKGPLSMEQLESVLIGDPKGGFNETHSVNMRLVMVFALNTGYDFFFCGPSEFMKSVFKGLHGWDVPKSQIHYEYFGPHSDLTD